MSGGKRGRVEVGTKRVRVVFGGRVIADSTAPRLVWEFPYCPTYYLPLVDVDGDRLTATGRTRRSPQRGEGRLCTVRAGRFEAADAALSYPDSPIDELRGTVRFEWDRMDAWFEEDEQVHTHPRDPYVRVDVLPSSRAVTVTVDDVVLAESPRSHLLFETGLPTRYYLPRTNVRLELLEPSPTTTSCPYKGTARYWSVRVGERLYPDLAWSYPTPVAESLRVAGLVAFLDEKVTLTVDGVPEQRVRSRFG